uniref:Glycine-rich protein n=1 Tax=Oryza meridionalis TaxID=40149 RepID=A0A0E0C007_9ORYZ
MEKSSKMMAVAAVLVLVLAVVGAAEARNIKTAAAAESKDTVVQPTTFPPFDRFGSAVPAFGGMPGSIPGFSLPGSSGSTPGGLGGFGSMPMFGGLGGGSPGLGGGMPGSPAAADKQAKKP